MLNNDDNDLLFSDDDDSELIEQHGKYPWLVLIVDDEIDIHQVTKLALKEFQFKGRPIKFLSAYSGREAQDIMSKENDIALVLLDVVMESTHAGLDTVKWIREELGNHNIRIVLRTGQPGEAPEKSVIVDYDINDYKEKSELTSQRLFTTVCASLRSYQDISAIEKNRQGLRKIIDASAAIFKYQSFTQFATGALEQLSTLLNIQEGGTYSLNDGLAAHKKSSRWVILAGTEKYADMAGVDPESLLDIDFEVFFENSEETFILEKNRLVAHFEVGKNQRAVLILDGIVNHKAFDVALVELFIRNTTIAYKNIVLIEQVEKTQKEIIYRLGQAAENRSQETGNHVKRVSHVSYLLAKKYGLTETEALAIKLASPLHDVGKIGIPDAILNKKGKLDAQEWEIMKTHTQLGFDILRDSEWETIDLAAQISRCHHERWDGNGYPEGLSGENISIASRITAIADVFDALASKRCYKEPWPMHKVKTLFLEEKGKHFDPQLVDLFLDSWDEFVAIRDKFADVV